MSEDEMAVLMVCAGLSCFIWGRWYYSLCRTFVPSSKMALRRVLSGVLPICLLAIFAVLKTAASFDVRDSSIYLIFYVIFGVAWLGAGLFLFRLLGLFAVDDAVERNNPAAVAAVCSGLFGLAGIYAGANIGDGPGWWCVAFAAGLGTAVWFGVLALYQVAGNVAEEITVNRNINSAIRFGGVAIGAGVFCGRGSAGDWTSAAQTVHEFAAAWPVLILLVVACIAERVFVGAKNEDLPLNQIRMPSMLLAFLYVMFSVAAVSMVIPPLP